MASGPANLNRCDLARAIIAVIALYGFVLQGFLGGMMPIPASADGLCAGHTQTEGAPDKSSPHDRGDCCAAAQAAGTALPPRTGAVALAWPAPAEARIAWTSRHALPARAPPGRIAPPRGPPAA